MLKTPNAVDELVGRNVKYCRIERGMTILYVARALDLDVEAVSAGEAGGRRFCAAEIQKLCSLLKISPANIYEQRDPPLVA